MDRTISALLEKNVTTVDVENSIDEVEEVLNSHKLSCVPVVDSSGHCFGVISAPDLVNFHALHKNPKIERAGEACTHNVIEAGPDISVAEAADLMVKNKIHHIVVIEKDAIKGIISSIDLVGEYLLKQPA